MDILYGKLDSKFRRKKEFPFFELDKVSFYTLLALAVLIPHRIYLRLYSVFKKQPNFVYSIKNYEIEEKKWSIYDVIDADIYIAFGVNSVSAEIAAYCKARNKNFLLIIASDNDCSSQWKEKPEDVGPYGDLGYLNAYCIENASAILVQSNQQATLLSHNYDRKVLGVLKNPYWDELEYDESPISKRIKALWVGKADNVKQPLLYIELAKRFPDTEFTLVMNSSIQDVSNTVKNTMPSNVNLIEFVSFTEIEKYFSESFVLVNTSVFEGFPNTFLQAGKYGVPILSLSVDPEKMLSEGGGGVCAANNFDLFVEGFEQILRDIEFRKLISLKVRAYVRKFHNPDNSARKLKSYIYEIFQ
ncbi:MAG: glycosyltransferase [Bacteroidales bacterium]|nr:glycosyltransferase [Bacteroidales bacterium]